MGLFSNSKKLCPVCGSPTPRLLATVIGETPICKKCAKKADMPESVRQRMSVEEFCQYIAFYDGNQTLRNMFQETFRFDCGGWGNYMSIDMDHKLFRWKNEEEALVLEGSQLRAFRILEDERVLFESSPQGLKCYTSDIPARAEAMAPMISQFKIQMEQYRQMEKMDEMLKKNGGDGTSLYMSRPSFEGQVIRSLQIEMTLDHPYWGGIHRRDCEAPKFDDTYPSVDRFLRDYQGKLAELHALAINLMIFIDPDAPEIQAGASRGGTVAGELRTLPVIDPVGEIQKYKALLDSGVITEEEFAAKKRQLLGI